MEERSLEWYERLDEECDALFLILDTARHHGWRPSTEEIMEHVERCPTCAMRNGWILHDVQR